LSNGAFVAPGMDYLLAKFQKTPGLDHVDFFPAPDASIPWNIGSQNAKKISLCSILNMRKKDG
jgi:hypothetical protein